MKKDDAVFVSPKDMKIFGNSRQRGKMRDKHKRGLPANTRNLALWGENMTSRTVAIFAAAG